MTRTEAVKEFFKKAVLPVAIAGLLYCIFKSACIRNGELDLLWLWILCGLPLRVRRKRSGRLLRLRVWRCGRGLWILRCSLWGILMFMVVRV